MSAAPASRTRRTRHTRRARSARPALALAALLVLALVVVRVLVGTPMVTPAEALAVLGGELVPGVSFIVLDSRLPAAAVGALAGVALGLAGTVFQSLLRNPLASPDIIGVTLGASAGAVVAMVFFQASGGLLFWSALLGGLATAALVLAVAGTHRPGAAGAVDNRFVLVGIGVAAALGALVSYLLTRVTTTTAGDITHWLVGSLSGATWGRVAVLAGALLVLVPVLAVLVGRLRILALGDETATSLGLNVPATRTALVLVAVVLTSLTVAVTGPLAFVAFVAGPLARMILGRSSFPLAALLGAVVVLAAENVGQNLVAGADLPAGVVTGAFGAPFLLWLLTRDPSDRT